MTVKSYKLGPGTLTLGAAPLDVSGQITNCRVEASENVTTIGDALELLSGETLAAEESAAYRFTLAGSLVQDLAANGVIDYTWLNKGLEVPFTFVPSTAEGREVTGVVVPIPLTIGGDVKSRPTSDFSWRVIGDPDFDAVGA